MFFSLGIDGSMTQIGSVFPNKRYVCALGCFDGVHKGHQALLKETIEIAKNGFVPSIWTFSEPLSFPYIEKVASRLALCGKSGIKFAFCEEYSRYKEISPIQFIDILVEEMNVAHIVCGRDFTFGADRQGNVSMLEKWCKDYGIGITVVPDVVESLNGEPCKVSSTVIRKMVSEGDMEEAKAFLGRPFSIRGVVIDGNKIGRTISVPTINQNLENERVVPKFGVYDSICRIGDKAFPSVTNIGIRPTVNRNTDNVTCETHIIGQDLDIYGMIAEVEFHRYNREERRFETLDDLKAQIAKDIEHSKRYFNVE